jgi:RNA-directed DNA polymerase
MMQDGSSLNLEDVCSHLGIMSSAVLDVSQHAWRHYTKFARPKRTGGVRIISASQGRLKSMQRVLLDGLLADFPMPAHVHGCVKGRSAATNAQMHVDREVVINVDLSNFFGSVCFDTVKQVFIEHFRFDEDAAEVFARLTVIGGGLPQGAPTSPVLANLAALKLDAEIMRTCDEAVTSSGYRYSRYVDDITVSGVIDLVALVPKIYECIDRNGFSPNVKKTKILRRSIRQSVTGVVVNKKLSVPKTLIRKVRQQLYYCQKWGIKEHCESQGIRTDRFLKTLRGSIAYIGATKPDLATEFAFALYTAAADLEETLEEINLRLLKQMIDNGEVAEFYYYGEKHRAAPSAITVDNEDVLLVRAFQLSPEQGWRFFLLSEIQDLEVAR